MKTRALTSLALLAALGFGLLFLPANPPPMTAADLPQHTANAENGKVMYNVAGCISCHKPSPDLAGVAADVPAGGAPFKTPIGVFYPPNLTPDPETGIGKMSDVEFVNVVQRGITPEGEHLTPALPYTSYAHMRTEDVLDIKAYLSTLPAVVSPEKEADIPVAWLLRRGVRLWKRLGLSTTPWTDDTTQTASWNRGGYLVNGAGHCNECHTPRNVFMLQDDGKKLSGGPHPGGEGKVPSLRDLVGRKRYKDAADLALALANGELLGYEKLSSGGMGDVQSNLSKLPEADVNAIAEYLTSLK